MNYSKTLKPNLVGEPYQIKQCSSLYLSVDFNWLYYSKEVYGHATNGVMTQHEAKCTLLRREIPMAWGTTRDILTPEISLFQYAIESKFITLNYQTSYLILDG